MKQERARRPLTRRSLLRGGAGLGLLAASGGARAGDAPAWRFFRIGSGSSGGMYYPLAGLLAAAISEPIGSDGCVDYHDCDSPGLFMVAQTSRGSVQNLHNLFERNVESIFCQADLARRVAEGRQEGFAPERGAELRAIAYLFPEFLHVVVRKDAGIRQFADLTGKSISMGDQGSGTRADGDLLLTAFGLREGSLEEYNLPTVQAAARLRAGTLQAFLVISGVPATSVAGLAMEELIDLLPVEGPVADNLVARRPLFRRGQINPGIYRHVGLTPTVSVGALWLTRADLSDDLIFEVTRSLWSPETRLYLETNNRLLAPDPRLQDALLDIEMPPLHPGALRYYKAVGML